MYFIILKLTFPLEIAFLFAIWSVGQIEMLFFTLNFFPVYIMYSEKLNWFYSSFLL